MIESVFRRPIHRNDYGRTLLDGTREIFCRAQAAACVMLNRATAAIAVRLWKNIARA